MADNLELIENRPPSVAKLFWDRVDGALFCADRLIYGRFSDFSESTFILAFGGFMRILTNIGVLILFSIAATYAGKKLTLKDLPPSVQKAVQEQLKGGEIKSVSKETENGVAQYEIESTLNGKRRDFNVDSKGKLLVVEEETDIATIPATAKAAIEKKAAGGKISMVELFMRGGETLYEAAYTSKDGKKHEVLVKADGTETKD